MKFIADLHIHSPYSRATSKNNDVAGLFSWARVKGINIVGTGDFTHPGWLARLKECLRPAEPGLFRLRDENVPPVLPGANPDSVPVRFMLSSEISCIYKKGDKTRKIHTVLYVPDLESVEKINLKLAALGNIEADGRPILGLDARDLLEIFLETSAEGFMVPAHIWTPWFSLFGSKSGFDAIEDCFEDLTDHIFALETGLSSDPAMNRLISALDRYSLISNSDCHSPSKLGREANLFDTDFDFFSLRDSLKQTGANGFLGTIEFYPEEGKYHHDGHRKCNVRLDPSETRAADYLCPVCGRPLTIGVMHRVMELADRKTPKYPDHQRHFESLVPLPEILGEILNVGPASKKVTEQYRRIISLFGSEFKLFREVPIEEINRGYSELLGEAIRRIRTGKVIRKPGYDGEFGVIRVFDPNEMHQYAGLISYIPDIPKAEGVEETNPPIRQFKDIKKRRERGTDPEKRLQSPNAEQASSIESAEQRILVLAGPGTGKTFTLVAKIMALLKQNKRAAGGFAVIAFTNKAADEIRERLEKEIGPALEKMFVGTFHQFCLQRLRQEIPQLTVIGREERYRLLKNHFSELKEKEIDQFGKILAETHFEGWGPAADTGMPHRFRAQLHEYLKILEEKKAIDLEAIIPEMAQKLATNPVFRRATENSITHLFIDEFQDLNESQYQLVRFLAETSNVFAIGDPNQAIYGFRGSDPKYFYRFLEDFPVSMFRLKKNYRSAPSILNAASAVIKNNKVENPALLPQKEGGSIVEYHQFRSPAAEAEFVTQKIDRLVGGIRHLSVHSTNEESASTDAPMSFKSIAVLYRLSDLSREIAKALEKSGIPFQLVDSKPYFMRKELKPIYYLIRYAAEPNALDFLQLLEMIPGIGKRSIQLIETAIHEQPDFNSDILNDGILPPKALQAIESATSQVLSFRETAPASGVAEAVGKAMRFLEIDTASPDCIRFLELCGAFGKDLAAVSRHLYRNSLTTVYDDRAEAVALMTLHASKGLEFPVVFMVGLEEGIIPRNLPGIPEDVQEERRLFYVGQTRARQKLILTSSNKRTVFGAANQQTVSRFVTEIPDSLISKRFPKRQPERLAAGEQLSF